LKREEEADICKYLFIGELAIYVGFGIVDFDLNRRGGFVSTPVLNSNVNVAVSARVGNNKGGYSRVVAIVLNDCCAFDALQGLVFCGKPHLAASCSSISSNSRRNRVFVALINEVVVVVVHSDEDVTWWV